MPIRGNLVTGLAVPVTRRARLTVERALVQRQIRGEPVGSLSDLVLLTPGRTLHEKLLDGAKQFVRDYAVKGFQSLSPPESFIVWGPYKCRGFGMGSPTIKPTIAHLEAEDEDLFPDSADFIIQGQFLATTGRIPT